MNDRVDVKGVDTSTSTSTNTSTSISASTTRSIKGVYTSSATGGRCVTIWCVTSGGTVCFTPCCLCLASCCLGLGEVLELVPQGERVPHHVDVLSLPVGEAVDTPVAVAGSPLMPSLCGVDVWCGCVVWGKSVWEGCVGM